MAIEIPGAWEKALARLDGEAGVVLVVGECDTGKSTFCAVAASRAARSGKIVAVVDADTGQSDIGPPACVSMGMVSGPVERLEQVPAAAMEFVGATSPAGHLLQCAAAAQRMAQMARESADVVIVDTTGLVHGGLGRALKGAKVDLLQPRLLIALEREGELETLLAPYRHRSRPAVERLPVAGAVERKSAQERKSRRQRKFAEYLKGARPVALPWKGSTLEGSALLSGKPAPGHFCAYAEEKIGSEVVRVERTGNGLVALAKGERDRAAERAAGREGYEVEWLSRFDSLLVGMIDREGGTAGLGIVEQVDVEREQFVVATPLERMADIACIRLGSMRVARDGSELGEA